MDSNGDGLRDREGVDLALTYGTTTREIRQKAQAIIRQQLLQVGIRLDLIDYPPSVFFSGFAEAGPAATGQLDVYQLSSAIRFPDPDTADFLCSQLASMQNPGGVNWIAFCNQELNDLLVRQISQVGSPDAERQQTFHQISRIVFERAYFIGLWQDPDVWALSQRLLNVRLSGVTPFFNAAEWDVSG
jgi:peptide/nickel transport system substrate-binding protein